jgi:hypothetical protein
MHWQRSKSRNGGEQASNAAAYGSFRRRGRDATNMAEAAILREQFRKATTSTFDPVQIGDAALLPVTGQHTVKADILRALIAPAADTARDLRDVKRDESMTNRAINTLVGGEPNATAGLTVSTALAVS